MKWVVFATAPDQITAEMWRDLLRQDGIPCELHPGDRSLLLNVPAQPVRLRAPENVVSRAKALLDEHVSAGPDTTSEPG
jgi:hypothetical protein